MVGLVFSRCRRIQANPTEKAVLLISKALIQTHTEQNAFTRLPLGKRHEKFNSWFGYLLYDLK